MRVTHCKRKTWICNRTNLRGRRKRGWGRGRGRKARKGKGNGALPSIHNSPPFFPIPYPLFTHVYCYLLLQRNYKGELSLIVRVNVVLHGTVVADSDWHFDNLCWSHLQSQSELYHTPVDGIIRWLLTWLVNYVAMLVFIGRTVS